MASSAAASNVKLPTQPYLDMGKEEISRYYGPSFWTKRPLSRDDVIASHIAFIEKGSEEALRSVPFLLDISYGDTERQKLDMVDLNRLPSDCPIFIYIHGGYWQMLGREFYRYITLPIYEAGGAVVLVGYDLAPTVTLPEIINQIKKAVAYILDFAQKRGSRGVYVGGHSAGGHLAAMMLTVDWMSEFQVRPTILKGVALISGVFDIRPLVNTSENKALKLDNDTAWACSPFNHVNDIAKCCKHIMVLVAVGGDESPEFVRQSREYHEMLSSLGINCHYTEVEGDDHFTLVEKLQDSKYILTQKLLSLMKLGKQ